MFDSGSTGPGGFKRCQAGHLTLTMPLSSKGVFVWVAGGSPAMDMSPCIQARERNNTPVHFILLKTGV